MLSVGLIFICPLSFWYFNYTTTCIFARYDVRAGEIYNVFYTAYQAPLFISPPKFPYKILQAQKLITAILR